MQGNNNTFCTDYFENYIKDKQDEDIDKSLLNYQICNHPLKKKHFVWLNMDGFAFDQLKYIKEEISNDILIYKSVGPHYRQTGAIHETYMTGKPSLNLIGGQIAGDNIAIQIAQAKQLQQQNKVQLLGSKFPLFTLISSYVDKFEVGEEYGVLKLLCGMKSGNDTAAMFNWETVIDEFDFSKAGVHFDRDDLETILRKKYPKYLEDEDFEKKFSDCLSSGPFQNEDFSPNHSVIYYSSYTDSLNHAYSKSHSYNFYSYFKINKIMIQVIKYFQTHLKDAILFISSDHGGQFFNGEDNFCNHGCVSDNNHGILLVASNDTVGKGQTADINYLDLMPTIAQYLQGVNLPLFNKGKSQPFQKGVFQYEMLAKHMKFIQLKEYLRKIDGIELNEDDNLEAKYNDVLKRELTDAEKSTIVEEYSVINKKLQKQVQESERNKKDFRLINLLEILCLIGIGYIVVFNFKKALNEWRQLQTMQKVLILLITIMYFSENIVALNVQNIGYDFYETSFYVNVVILIAFFIFFSLYDFSKLTVKNMQMSFHKSDNNRNGDCEEQTNGYEQVPIDSSDSLDIFNMENSFNQKESKIKQIYAKIIKMPHHYSKKLDRFLTLKTCLLIVIAYNILFLFLIKMNAFVYTKKFFMETVTKWDSFNLFNYSIFILFYYYPKIKQMKIHRLHTIYYIILYIMMIGYDLIDLRYLIKKTDTQVFMCRLITVYYFCGLVYNIKRGCSLLRQDKEEQQSSSLSIFSNTTTRDTSSPAYDMKKKFFIFIHIDTAVFVFWIADEVERVYLIFLYFSLTVILKKIHLILNIVQAQNTKGLLNTFIINFFLTILLFKNAQVIYSAFKGTLSLDINLQAGNKTIGEFQDQTPIYTAILFGIDKMLVMIFVYMDITQCILRASIKQNIIKFDNQSKGLLAVILIKILVSGFQTCYNFFDESSFLSLFLWFAAMSVIALLTFLPYSIIKFVLSLNGLFGKTNFKKSSHHLSV